MTPAYKHLEARTRIGELTLSQWAGLFVGVMCAIAFAAWIAPFSGYVNFAVGVYIGGLPAGAIFLASVSEFDFWLLVRAAIAWHRADGRFNAGAGQSARGYSVAARPQPAAARRWQPSARARIALGSRAQLNGPVDERARGPQAGARRALGAGGRAAGARGARPDRAGDHSEGALVR